MAEAVRPTQQEVERRKQLIGLSKTRSLSRTEAKELQAIWGKEAWYSYASGEVGFLAFVVIQAIVSHLPSLLSRGGIDG